MSLLDKSYLTDAEEELKKRFDKAEADRKRMPSTASASQPSGRVDQITLPDEERGRMPFTKEKFLVKENPHLVDWEREVRKFLRNLSPEHEHRVTAVMIFEWATGLEVKVLTETTTEFESGKPNWRSDLRKLNAILSFYFGKPYTTWIMGRKVGKAYKVKKGYYITRHRPKTLTLYAEYAEGVLRP
jgi:spore cortex formation protein SpoVR/YcgB (stage V sporulation)